MQVQLVDGLKLPKKRDTKGLREKEATRAQLSAEERGVLSEVLTQDAVYADLLLSRLNIDLAYQDRPREGMVKLISENFNQVMLGVFIVSKRPDGSYWLCDGATRKLALELGGRGGMTVRCQVIKTDGQKQEALLFKYYNSARKTVPLANRFNAEDVAGTDKGRGAIIRKAGFAQSGKSSGKNVLTGSGFIDAAFRLDDDGTALSKALFAVKEAWDGKHRIHGNTVYGIAVLYHLHRARSIDKQVRAVLKRYTPERLDELVNKVWGGGKKMGAKLRPNDRPQFVAKAIALDANRRDRSGTKLNVDKIDEFRVASL